MKNVIKPFIPILVIAIYFAFVYVVDLFQEGIVDTIPELISENLLFIGFILILILIEKKIWKKEKEKVRLDSLITLIIILAFPGIRLLFDRGMIYTKDFLKMNYILRYYTDEINAIETVNDVISGIIFAPVIEELLFRKIPILTFKSRFGKIYAMLSSSLIFGILHSGQTRFQSVFMGIILSAIFLMTNNIKITILLHILSNGMSTICFFISRSIKDVNVLSHAGSSIYCNFEILVVAVVISIISIYTYKICIRRRLENESISDT